MIPVSEVEVFADGLDHPESVAVHPDGSVWAGGEAGQIYRIPPSGGTPEEVARVPGGFVLGIAFSPDASWLALCEWKHHLLYRMDVKRANLEVFAKSAGDHQIEIPNYAAFRDRGELFVSESGSFTGKTGMIMRFDQGGRGEVWHPGPFQFANGIAFAGDESFLYVVETFGRPGVTRIAVQPDGSAGTCERFCDLPGTVPDGLAFGADGTLYVGCYAPSRIYAVNPDGKAEVLVEDWTAHALSNCTNLAFGGKEWDRLYAANLGRWHIAAINLGRRGQPLPCHRFRR